MNAKKLLTATLLLFVAAAMVTLIVKERRNGTSSNRSGEAVADAPAPEDGLVAYYFHGKIRCPTCESIESYSHEAIETGFADELNSGTIAWRVLNYELPANAHFATDYEIIAPTVVVVRNAHGEQADWRNLGRVWELVGDKEAFIEYIQAETKELLGETGV